MIDSKMEVRTTDRELIFTRMLDAPRKLVFEAYSSCEHLSHWWGPRMWPMAECTLDFRVGGTWHYCMRGPNEGDEAWGKAVYQEIVEPERIVYADSFSDKDGNLNQELPQGIVTMEFAEDGQRTRLTGRTLYPSHDDLEKVLEMGVIEGMTETIDRLAEHVERSS